MTFCIYRKARASLIKARDYRRSVLFGHLLFDDSITALQDFHTHISLTKSARLLSILISFFACIELILNA